MIRSSFILMLLTSVVCSFCEKDFVTLGRHSWRCKQRVNYAEQDHSAENTARQTPVMNSPNVVVSSRTVIKCCCGKVCKGARGLKTASSPVAFKGGRGKREKIICWAREE
jgi:glutaredoxin